MAFLYRRKRPDGTKAPIYWACIDRPGQKPLRESTVTGNKQLAEKWLAARREELWKERELGIKPDKLFSDYYEDFLADRKKNSRKDKTLDGYRQQLEWWASEFKGLNLRQIDQGLIVETIKKKENDSKASTCNRYLAVLRACLRLAHRKHQLIEAVPAFFMYQEPKARVRWLKPWEIVKLLDALPAHVRDMAEFTLATGLRKGNVKGLEWREVDLSSKTLCIEGIKMKNGEPLALPLTETAHDVIVRQIGKHPTAVFTFKGQPVKWIGQATWKKALEKAGIEDFRWHDLRHTWATMLIQKGVPAKALQVLGAWETPNMVDKYAHHATESLRPFAEVVDSIFGKKKPPSAHDSAQGGVEGGPRQPSEVAVTL